MVMDSILGVVFPLPKDTIDFMFSNCRDVFVKYMGRCPQKKSFKIKEGMTLYLYQSGGSQSIVGEAIIKNIDLLDMSSILDNYSERLFLSEEMFRQYANNREEKKAYVFELTDLKRYDPAIQLSQQINMGGLYITTENKSAVFK
jgi:hypothetical protein